MQMCSAELQEVLKRYDVAAVVLLHEPGQCVYFVKLDPSYSLATMKNNTLELTRPKPDLEHPDSIPSGPADTVNMFRNLCGLMSNLMKVMAQSLSSAQIFYNLTPKGGGAPPHINGGCRPPKTN